jgi:hypothetical protein
VVKSMAMDADEREAKFDELVAFASGPAISLVAPLHGAAGIKALPLEGCGRSGAVLAIGPEFNARLGIFRNRRAHL